MIQRLHKLAKSLPADDIRLDDYVAQLRIIYQYPSYLWNGADTTTLPPNQPVTIEWNQSTEEAPLRVKAICLPFVFVQTVDDRYRTLDVRRETLVRLDADYGDFVWKTLKNRDKSKSDKKKKKKGKRKSKKG